MKRRHINTLVAIILTWLIEHIDNIETINGDICYIVYNSADQIWSEWHNEDYKNENGEVSSMSKWARLRDEKRFKHRSYSCSQVNKT